MIDPETLSLDAEARADYIRCLSGVDHWFETYIAHLALLKVIGCREEKCRLGRSHRAISEIEFAFSVHDGTKVINISYSD